MNTNLQINYILNNIPYYQCYSEKKILSLEELPVVNKLLIRDHYADFISDELGNMKTTLVSILEKPIIKYGESYNEIYSFDRFIIEETTGTSGTPFRCVKTLQERTKIALEMWKQRKLLDNRININNFFQFNHTGINMLNPQAYNYNNEHIFKLYKTIEENQIRWIHSSPFPLIKHIEIIKENNFKFNFENLKYIECTGNHYSDEIKRCIEDFFDVKLVNQYGSIETWEIATSCNENLLHINENITEVELLDETGNVITENDIYGKVVVTTLINKVFPFIRYDTGDYAIYRKKTCQCGNEGRVLQLLEGREVNVIKGLPEKIFGNILFHKIVQRIVHEIPEAQRINYIQIFQIDLNVFCININDFAGVEKVIDRFKNLTQERLSNRYEFMIRFMSQHEINSKRFEKPNLFLCKCL